MILALVTDRAAQARLVDALRSRAAVHFVDRCDEVFRLVTDPRVRTVIVEPRDGAGTPVTPLVRELRRGYPSVAVLAYCAVTGATSHEILDMARAGVHDLLLRGIDDGRLALQAVLVSAESVCIASVAMRELDPLLPPEVQPFVQFCLENAARTIRVEEAALALGVHRRTLVNRLSQAGLPAPSAIIGWCRLTLAARLLEDPDRRLEHIALALDFPSASAVRNMLRRYAGLRPQEVRENGGLRCVLHAFKRALSRPVPLAQPESLFSARTPADPALRVQRHPGPPDHRDLPPEAR